jgi:hypothetical protein
MDAGNEKQHFNEFINLTTTTYLANPTKAQGKKFLATAPALAHNYSFGGYLRFLIEPL